MQLPDQVRDAWTKRDGWVPVPDVLARGLAYPRRLRKSDWWDYYMRLDDS